ncbi:uncharacterized protein LOC132744670 [Ruditapes philippinarum]|uniref:uncharacterized protein LOC132744670 n=1 Tax=Ruditapes philippinarum TaxID=129788 RepID=UPI00295C0C21|nr:uncharacterized protein LOC132744670 [Ruditapes philippinarum]
MYFNFIVNRPSKRLYESDSGTDENETDTESRPPQVFDQATTPKESQSLLSSPPRLSAQALREASSDVQSASPIQGASDTPFCGQIIGPTAVTQILRVLETMREKNREIKRMVQRMLLRSAADDNRCNFRNISHSLFVILSRWKHSMSFWEIRQCSHLC